MQEPDDWREQAKCHGEDLRDWVTELMPSKNPRVRRLAAVGKCSGCPVFERCGLEVLQNKEHGVIQAGEALDGVMGEVLYEQYDRIRERLGLPRVLDHEADSEPITSWPRACKTCGHSMRPRTESEIVWPNTVPSHTKSMCRACYKKTIPPVERFAGYPSTCKTCGSSTRPRTEQINEEKWPNTVRASTIDECHACHVRKMNEGKRHG
jgi:hypothetical protein